MQSWKYGAIILVLGVFVTGHQFDNLSAQDNQNGPTGDTAVASASESDLQIALQAVTDAMAAKRAAEKEIDGIEQRRQEEERRAAEAQRKLAEEKLAAIDRQLKASTTLTAARSRVAAITAQLAVIEQMRDAEIRLADANRRLGLSQNPEPQPAVKAQVTEAVVTTQPKPAEGLAMQLNDDKGDIIEKFEDGSWGVSLSTGPTFVVKKQPTKIANDPKGKVITYSDGTRELVDAKGNRQEFKG